MNVFCVFTSDETVHKAIAREYSNYHHKLFDDVWAIADKEADSVDVSQRLGIGENSGGGVGVIVRLDNYYGHFNGALWQKVNTWKSTPNG